MLHISISLRALVFVLLLAAMALTGSDVARGAPAGLTVLENNITFATGGQDMAHDINVPDNLGGLRFYGCPALEVNPQCAAIQFFGNASSGFPGQLFLDAGKTNSGAIIFRSATTSPDIPITERMRVAASGNVGIGTSNPAHRLDVDFGDILVQGPNGWGHDGDQATLYLGDNLNYIRNVFNGGIRIGAFLAPDALAVNNFNGRVGVNTTLPTHRFEVKTDVSEFGIAHTDGTRTIATFLGGASIDGGWIGTESNHPLNLFTNNGSAQLTVATTGNVGIGRNPAANRLEVEGTASKTAAGDWLANSDARIKRDIYRLDGALAILGRLHPARFRYTEAYLAEHPIIQDREYVGYIAQEFREVFPDSVQDSGEDGILQIDSHAAEVYAVRAIQELHALVREQDARIATLEQENAGLTARLSASEQQNAALVQQNAQLDARLSALEQGEVAPDRMSALPLNGSWQLLALVAVAGLAIAVRRRRHVAQ
jgi:hypothetical protein